ncbi:hypothetical protein BJX76DRAFT_358835 [Aspergillus varians]
MSELTTDLYPTITSEQELTTTSESTLPIGTIETVTTAPTTSTDTSASQTTDEAPSNTNSQWTTVTLYSPLPTTTTSSDNANGLSTGAKAGIGVGVSLGALLIIAGAILFLFRRHQGRRNGGLDATPVSEGTASPAEMEATERRVFELPDRNKSRLSPSEAPRETHELDAL